MPNTNTIQLRLIVKDDGSVVIDQAAGKIEQFGKKNQQAAQSSVSAWGKVKSAWLEIIAAIYAAQKAWDYMDMAAKADQAEVAFRSAAESLGVNADDMVAKMKKASRETIDDSHLMQKALKAMVQDVDPNKIPQLFDAARVGAVKAGEDISDVADQIIDAIANEMPRGLRKFGLVTKEQMTVFNKAVASGAENLELIDLVIANASLQEANLALQSDNAAIAMQRFKAQVDELKSAIGGGLLSALQKAFGIFQWLAVGVTQAAASFLDFIAGADNVSAWINTKLGRTDVAAKMRAEAQFMKEQADALRASADDLMTKAMGNITGKVEPDDSGKTKTDWEKQQADAQKQIDAWMAKAKAAAGAAEAAKKLEEANKKITEATQQSQENIIGIREGAYAKEMAMIQNDVAEYQKAGVSKAKIDEFVAARKAEVQAAAQKQIEDDIRTSEINIIGYTEGAYAKEMALLNDKVEEYRKAGATEIEIERYVAIRKKEIAETISKDKLDAERDLYKDLREYSGEYFETTKKLIEEQAKKYRELGIDEGAIAAWVKEENINAFIEMAEKSNNWADGVSAAIERIRRDAMTMGKAAEEMVMEFSTQAKNTLSTVFFDAAKGELKSFGDYWNALFDSLEKKFLDICSQMLVDWIMTQANMKKSSSSSSGLLGIFESILGAIGGFFTGGSGTVKQLGTPGPGQAIAHAGGLIGFDSFPVRHLPPGLFANAYRFHGGLASDEFPAILQRGERVLSKKEVAAEKGEKSNVINIANIVSPDLLDSYLASSRGKNAFLNVISSNPGAFKRALRG